MTKNSWLLFTSHHCIMKWYNIIFPENASRGRANQRGTIELKDRAQFTSLSSTISQCLIMSTLGICASKSWETSADCWVHATAEWIASPILHNSDFYGSCGMSSNLSTLSSCQKWGQRLVTFVVKEEWVKSCSSPEQNALRQESQLIRVMELWTDSLEFVLPVPALFLVIKISKPRNYQTSLQHLSRATSFFLMDYC